MRIAERSPLSRPQDRPARLIALIVLLAGSTAHAQIGDSIASVSYDRFPDSAAPYGQPQQVELQQLRFRAGYPLFLFDKRTILIPGFSYERLEIQQRGDVMFHVGVLHAPTLTLTAVQLVSDRLMLIGSFGVGLASDFDDSVSSDDVQLRATAFGLYKFTPAFSFGAGITYDRLTGSLQPLPAVAIKWRISDRARVRGFVPAAVSADYHVNSWLTAGMQMRLDGNRFHLSESRSGVAGLQLATSTLAIGPKLSFQLAPLLHFDVHASMTAMQRYEVVRRSDDERIDYTTPMLTMGARFWVGPSGWD